MTKLHYPLVSKIFDQEDIKSGIKVLNSKNITMGKITKKFENYFKKTLGCKYSAMTNSGSSAILLILQTLINPYRKNKLKPGDEVLIPAICWSTSLWPIIQSQLKPVFVDVDKNTLNIDINDLKKKITKKTKAIMLIHVLGNCTNMSEIILIKNKYKLILIEDNCEGLGTKFNNKFLGTFGDFGAYSFYASHQISGGEGGMITCSNFEDYEIIKSLRSHGWSRELSVNKKTIFKPNKNHNKKFTFFNSGYNLRPTEVSAAISFSQFKKLRKIKKNRKNNFNKIIKILNKEIICKKNLYFFNENKNVDPCWLAFPIILKNKKINKKIFLEKLYSYGVESRPIISGDFTLQPAAKIYNLKKERHKNSRFVHNYGFFIGLSSRNIKNNQLLKIKNSFIKSFEYLNNL
ncbi:MAG: aminotransferase class I/II-fold pyridoxal phosphate-dependent enzyme [Pelagibacteraceae bacterium]|nr:aminotransferase class I/II-fold pyridoxal phosphate-dependent enzyme [Pelagibacteraceae bacterium]